MSHTLSMMRRRLLSFVLLAGATASLGLASAPVHAAPTVRLAGNVTVVALSSDFAGALTALGLTADSLGLSALVDGRAYFPISSGAVDAASARGEINHLGGLILDCCYIAITAGKSAPATRAYSSPLLALAQLRLPRAGIAFQG